MRKTLPGKTSPTTKRKEENYSSVQVSLLDLLERKGKKRNRKERNDSCIQNMSQWNREIAPVLYQHTTRQMGRRPAGMPHKADKLDSAVNVLCCCCPGIMEALSRVPAIRGDARTCRWDSLTGKLTR